MRDKRLPVVSIFISLVLCGVACAQDAKPASTLHFKRVVVNDPGINNIEACSFLTPTDWKVDGGIKWFPDYSILANLLMRITDPQTGAQIEFLPAQNFTFIPHPVMPMQPGTNYMGNIVCQPITDLNQFVQTFYAPQALPQLRGAKPIKEEELPKIEQTISQNYGGQARVKACRVRYEYNNNGKAWQEDIYLAFVYSQFGENVIWSVVTSYSFRAPKGKLDELTPVMATTINTYRLTQDWYSGYMYVQKLFMNRMNQGIADAKALSDTITKNSEEIRKMFADSYKQQQDSQDRISESRSETMRGVETFKNPFENRPIELPSGYNDAWVNAKGEYILSNTAGYDPNVSNPNEGDTSEWRRMDRRDQNGR